MVDYWLFYKNIVGNIYGSKEDKQCNSKCKSIYDECINSEKIENNKLQCREEKRACFQQCDDATLKRMKERKERKWCQNPDTNEYVLCEEQQE